MANLFDVAMPALARWRIAWSLPVFGKIVLLVSAVLVCWTASTQLASDFAIPQFKELSLMEAVLAQKTRGSGVGKICAKPASQEGNSLRPIWRYGEFGMPAAQAPGALKAMIELIVLAHDWNAGDTPQVEISNDCAAVAAKDGDVLIVDADEVVRKQACNLTAGHMIQAVQTTECSSFRFGANQTGTFIKYKVRNMCTGKDEIQYKNSCECVAGTVWDPVLHCVFPADVPSRK
jgi:hypothetical protein